MRILLLKNFAFSFFLFFISLSATAAVFGPEVTDVVVLSGDRTKNVEMIAQGFQSVLGKDHVFAIGDGTRSITWREVEEIIEKVKDRPRVLFVIKAHGMSYDSQYKPVFKPEANLQEIWHFTLSLIKERVDAEEPLHVFELFTEIAKIGKPVDVLLQSCYGGACSLSARATLPEGSTFASMGNELESTMTWTSVELGERLQAQSASIRPLSLAKTMGMWIGANRTYHPIFGIVGKGTVYSEGLLEENYPKNLSENEQRNLYQLAKDLGHGDAVDRVFSHDRSGVTQPADQQVRKMISFFQTDWFSAPASVFESTKPCRLLMKNKIIAPTATNPE